MNRPTDCATIPPGSRASSVARWPRPTLGLTIAAAVLLAACAPTYDQKGGPEIAAAIEAADAAIIESVAYSTGDYMDAAEIMVFVRDDTTLDDIRAFACTVVRPILVTGNPPDSLTVTFIRPDQETLASEDEFDC